MDRRLLLGGGLTGIALLSACQTNAQPVSLSTPHEIKLWPGGAPGRQGFTATFNAQNETERGLQVGRSVAGVSDPVVNIYKAATPQDTAILVIPGGGFKRVWIDKEGDQICRWLNREGISAASLVYRLPDEGWAAKEDTPLQDAKRAMRILARETGARRIGIMGFSAGGTIAAALATRWSEPFYPPVDDADQLDPRPAFMALGYAYLNVPVIPSFKSMYHGMTAASPPAFIFAAADDKVVPIDNSVTAFKALTDLKIPAALHVFEQGGHGFALITGKNETVTQWPQMFVSWLRANGYIS